MESAFNPFSPFLLLVLKSSLFLCACEASSQMKLPARLASFFEMQLKKPVLFMFAEENSNYEE